MAPVVGEECILFSNTIAEVTNPVGLHLSVFLGLSCDRPISCVFYLFIFELLLLVCCLWHSTRSEYQIFCTLLIFTAMKR